METKQLKEMIYKRKSVRAYTGVPVGPDILERINAFSRNLKPLYPEIMVCSRIVNRGEIKTVMPWATPQLIAIFSEEKDGYLENAGFMFQQLELYLQSIGLGACWMGLGKLNKSALPAENDGMKFVILIAFGHPKGPQTREISEFKRKSLAEISDKADERLEPARLAPSSVNSQPWYFTHEDEQIGVYCAKKGLLKALSDMNRIDMGIALAHLYIACPDSFSFRKPDQNKQIKGYACLGSIAL